MTTDGGLRQLYLKHLPSVHWQPIETWSTGQGVPDCNGCEVGVEFWVENKVCAGGKFGYEPEQVGWIERRRRARGRVFVMVRVITTAGPRKGPARDEAWLFPGEAFRALVIGGLLNGVEWLLYKGEGGPAKWDWGRIRDILVDFDFLSLAKGAIESGHIKGDAP